MTDPYRAAYARRARARYAGFTDRELAAAFDVPRATIHQWRAAHPDFAEATTLGAMANERVERALYERATGYEEEAVRVFLPAGTGPPVIVRYAREVRADIDAALHWLRVRDPKIWARHGPPDDSGGLIERLRRAMARLAAAPT